MRAQVLPRMLAICVLVVGCSEDSTLPQYSDANTLASPENSANEVVARANAAAGDMGITVGNYVASAVTFDFVKRQWQVVYEGKALLVGDHFVVIIDEGNLDEIQLIQGL